MTTKRVLPEIAHAMKIAHESGWPTEIREDKVYISAPDGYTISSPLCPRDSTVKTVRATLRKYELSGVGPAMTPDQKRGMLQSAEEANYLAAEAANRQRRAYEAERVRKQEEAKEAARKAAEATAKGLVSRAAVVAAKSSGGRELKCSKYRREDGQYECPECKAQGVDWSARSPQGLTSHRAFRHRSTTKKDVESRVGLPDDIQAAMDLMSVAVLEHLASADDGRVAALEAEISQLKEEHRLSYKKLDGEHEDLKRNSTTALTAYKTQVASLKRQLESAKGNKDAEMRDVLQRLRGLLSQIQKIVRENAPVQAVGMVDEVVSKYVA